jgi:hypothetical protein
MPSLSLALALFVVVGGPAAGAPTCLRTSLIDRTKVVDDKTLDFRMKDGSVYRNVLVSRCVGLKFHGFVYVSRIDEICGNLQSIRILVTHDVCQLGEFIKLPATPVKQKS